MEGLYKRKRKVTERSWGAGALWMYVLLTICAMMYVNYRSNMCTVQAASANGTWGTCTWTLSEEGVLTVNSGTGEDVEYVDSQERRYGTPWSAYSDNIKEMIFGMDGTVVFPPKCSDMFKAYTKCEKITFHNVDTGAVTDMENMFEDCEELKTILGLEQFHTDKVTIMDNFFSNCTKLSAIDLTSFDTSGVNVDASYGMGDFFNNNTALQKICFGDHFTFKGSTAIELPPYTKWYKETDPATLISYDQLSEAETNGTITLSGTWLRAEGFYWGECKCTIKDKTLTIGAGKGENRYNKFYSPWEDYAEDIEYIVFEDGVVFPEDIHELFMRLDHLKEIDFSNVDMSQVKNTGYLFGYCASLKKVSMNAKLPAQPTNMSQTFASCYTLESVSLGNMDTSKVESFSSLFYECYNLQSFDFEKIDITSAQFLGQMFQQCYQLRMADMSSWKSDKVIDISWMFSACTSLTKVILPEQGMHVGRVNYSYGASSVFYNCSSLTSIENLDQLDTSGVEDMYSMFYGCKNLVALDLSSFDTTNVKMIYQMFYGCESLTELDLSSLDTTNIEMYEKIDGAWNYSMYGMFDGCDHLAKVTVGDKFVFKGGRSTKTSGITVAAAGSLPSNQINPEHVNEWYVYQSDVVGEAGKWVQNYGTDPKVADITDLKAAKRTFTKQEDGTITAPKQRVNFGNLQLKSNIKAQYDYTGEILRPEEGNTVLTATIDEKEVTLQEGVDYTVNYPAKSYYIGAYGLVYFNGIGEYCGEYTVSYYVCKGSKNSIDSCVEWLGSIMQYTYTGYEIKPLPVSIKDNGKVLTEGKDYRIQYKNNVNAAAYYSQNALRIYVYGIGDYVGSTYCSFTINPKPISSTSITAVFKKGTYPYTGEEIIPDDLIVTDGDTILRENVDYSVHYYDNKEIGDNARAGIWGEGNYSGIIYSYFTITERASNPNIPSDDRTDTTCDHIYEQTIAAKASFEKDGLITYTCTRCNHTYSEDISKVSSVRLSKSSYTYNGKSQKPSVVLSDRNGNTLNSVSYSIQYPKVAKNIGRYTLIITLSADQYEGRQKVTFDIVPQKIQKVKLQSGKKQIKIKWKKAKNINGYEIQYALSGGKKTVWKKTSTSKRKNSTVIKKLTKKKKYTIRIRSYKVVKCNGKKIRLYSDWVQKTIKTK